MQLYSFSLIVRPTSHIIDCNFLHYFRISPILHGTTIVYNRISNVAGKQAECRRSLDRRSSKLVEQKGVIEFVGSKNDMGLPRLSLKRCFLYAICITGMLVVVMNVRQKEIWHTVCSDTEPDQSSRVVSEGTKVNIHQIHSHNFPFNVSSLLISIQPNLY